MKNIKIFITGTDTHVGKTYVTTQLLKCLNALNFSTLGVKPLASGCIVSPNEMLVNEDALLLQQAASIKLPYSQVNPIALAPAIAPHLAAAEIDLNLTVKSLTEKIAPALNNQADFCLIEGAGGWYVPLNKKETMADFVIANQWPVILVVGMRLGCLNHALLTAKTIAQSGVKLIGFIANRLDQAMSHQAENILTLKTMLHIPCLGVVAFNGELDVEQVEKMMLTCL